MSLDKKALLAMLAKSKTEIAIYTRKSLLYYKDTDAPNPFVLLQPFFKLHPTGNDDKLFKGILQAYNINNPDAIKLLTLLHQKQLFNPSTIYAFLHHQSPQVLAAFVLQVNSIRTLDQAKLIEICGDSKFDDRVYAFNVLNKIKFSNQHDQHNLANLLLECPNPREAMDGFVLYIQTIVSTDQKRQVDFDELTSLYEKFGKTAHIELAEQYMKRYHPLSFVNAFVILYKNNIKLEQVNQININITGHIFKHPEPEELAQAYVILAKNNYLYSSGQYHLTHLYDISQASDPVKEANAWMKLSSEEKSFIELPIERDRFIERREPAPTVNFVAICAGDDGARLFKVKLKLPEEKVDEIINMYTKKKGTFTKFFSPVNEAINAMIRLVAVSDNNEVNSASLIKIFLEATFEEGHPTCQAYHAVLNLIGINDPDLIGTLQMLKDALLVKTYAIETVLENPYDYMRTAHKLIEKNQEPGLRSTSSL